MRMTGWCVLAVLAGVAISPWTRVRADDFQLSFAVGSRDTAGRFAGGTEMRLLTAHGGRLYAGNGYWEDRPGPEGPQGWYLVRWPGGQNDLHQVTAPFGHPLIAPRSILVSPFAGEGSALYFAGYDAIKAPAHNTAWIARAMLSAALGPSR
jgi:hypothetical protein